MNSWTTGAECKSIDFQQIRIVLISVFWRKKGKVVRSLKIKLRISKADVSVITIGLLLPQRADLITKTLDPPISLHSHYSLQYPLI